MSGVLHTVGLAKYFGAIPATDDVTFTLEAGARHALIGPNGAGKTTFINLITGTLAPSAGRVFLDGVDVTRLSPEARVKRGLARTFQINQLFSTMTPFETLMIVIGERHGVGGVSWRTALSHRAISEEVAEIAQRFRLDDALHQPVVTLPYGRQRLLEIAIAVSCRPKVLLLDEPAAGVPEADRREILDIIGALPADVAILLIEHDMDVVFRFAKRISVLVNGKLFAEGAAAEIAQDPRVRAIYLGEAHHG